MGLSEIFERAKEAIVYAWDVIVGTITSISISLTDILDIIVVAFIIYKAVQLMRETRAEPLFKGSAVLLISYFIADKLDMVTMRWLFDNIIFQVGIVALVVVFQPELRRALERVGRSNLSSFGRALTAEETEEVQRKTIDAICKGCAECAKTKTGALIVLERSTPLGEIINTGTILDAECSYQLLLNVFYPKSPLHDGAVIIKNAKLYAAACILPLSENPDIARELGTRHRAAIGMSENSDAVVIIVSEETGTISVAANGVITRGYNSVTLYAVLEKAISGEKEEDKTGAWNAIKRKLRTVRKKSDEK